MVFQTWYGHFEYHVIFFGLSNVPTTFQDYVNKILAKKLNIFIIVNLDIILIYTKDVGQNHVNAMQWIFENLQKYSFLAN